MKGISIRIGEELHLEIQIWCAKTGKPLQDYMIGHILADMMTSVEQVAKR